MSRRRESHPEPEVVAPAPEVAPMSTGDADAGADQILKLLAPLQKAKAILVTANIAERDLGLVQGKLREAEAKLESVRAQIIKDQEAADARATSLAAKRQADYEGLSNAISAKRDALDEITKKIEQAQREHADLMRQHKIELDLVLNEKRAAEDYLEAGRRLLSRTVA